MGIISTLKSLLGLSSPRADGSGDAGTAVAVEREPEAASERAVKGIEPRDDPEPTPPSSEPAADAQPADASTPDGSPVAGDPVDPASAPGDSESAPGDPESAPGDPESAPGDPESAPGDPESAPAETGAAHAEPDGEPVVSIKGIGDAYANRLADAGVHTVRDLAAADAEELADAIDLGSGRTGNWIERARARSD